MYHFVTKSSHKTYQLMVFLTEGESCPPVYRIPLQLGECCRGRRPAQCTATLQLTLIAAMDIMSMSR